MCSKKANKKTRGEILLEDWTLDIGHLKIAPIFGIHTPTPQTSGDGNIGGAQEGAGSVWKGRTRGGPVEMEATPTKSCRMDRLHPNLGRMRWAGGFPHSEKGVEVGASRGSPLDNGAHRRSGRELGAGGRGRWATGGRPGRGWR